MVMMWLVIPLCMGLSKANSNIVKKDLIFFKRECLKQELKCIITKFIFSQNSPPSHLAMPWCTDNLGHVQNPPNSKLLCTKTFMVFIWGHLEANPTLTSQKPRISFYHKTPHQAIYPFHNPTHGSFAPLAFQPSAMTNCANQRFLSY